MKIIGLIGGLSWYSTSVYYQKINEGINQRLGGAQYGQIILYSVNFHEFNLFQQQGQWDKIELMITDIALRLQHAGADCIAICSNTPHFIADKVESKLDIPLLHIATETAKEISKLQLSPVGLLGTRFTMEEDFFTDKLKAAGIESIIPPLEDRNFIHQTIFEELSRGIYSESTRSEYLSIISQLKSAGAKGIIFGCSEISLLINPDNLEIPVFDTTVIHSKSAVKFSLA